MSTWLMRVLSKEAGYEAELLERYSGRLIAFARQELPARIRQRVDPEDVVQSVYRSFFRRLNAGDFKFEGSHDVWRLLAAMTFHKAKNTVKHHLRECRDVRRETPPTRTADSTRGALELAAPPQWDDVDVLFDCLEQLLAVLPENHREIVVRRLEGDTIEQIAQRVQRTRQTVHRILARVQVVAAKLIESAA